MATQLPILTETAASLADLQRNPIETLYKANGDAIAILNRDEPAFYAVLPDVYEAMLELLDDYSLAEIVRERRQQPRVEVNLDEYL